MPEFHVARFSPSAPLKSNENLITSVVLSIKISSQAQEERLAAEIYSYLLNEVEFNVGSLRIASSH